MTLRDCMTRLQKALLVGGQGCRNPRRPLLATETLEDRTVPAIILWTNRGTDASDTDNFTATYGVNSNIARAIVDKAIDDWEEVIVDFNYAGGGNTYSLFIDAGDLGGGGRGVTTNLNTDADGKPTDADIRMDDAGGTGGWYFDTVPGDDAEFTALLTAFAANGSNALGGNDFYRTIVHEMGHAMGIASGGSLAINNFLTPAGTDQVDNAETLSLFTGASVSATLTSDGGRHIYEGPADPAFPNAPTNPNDLLNSGRTVGFPPPTRQLISNLDALILKDAYNYTIQLPSTLNSFFANVNLTTGVLTVNGGPGASNDNILIDHDGGVRVQVNGTVETFPGVVVTAINVLAGDGNDGVTVGGGLLGIPITVDGGSGDDTIVGGDVTITGGLGDDIITGGPGHDNLDGGGGNDVIDGLGGNDVITGGDNDDEIHGGDGNDNLSGGSGNDTIHAGTGNNVVSDGSGNDTIDLSQNSVAVSYTTGGGNDTVIGTPFNDVLNGGSGTDRLEGRGGSDQIDGNGGADQLFGGDDSDTIVWDPGDGSDLVEGETGTDVMVFNGSGGAEVFTLSAVGARLELLRDVGGIDMDVAGVEQVNLNALGGADAATVNDLTQTEVQVVNVNVGAGDADGVAVNGRTVADNLLVTAAAGVVKTAGLEYDVNVSAATAADTLTVNGNDGDDSIKAAAGVEAVIAIVLNGGNGNDSLSADATLNGGADNDVLVGGAGNDALNGGDGDDVLDGRGGSNALDGGAGTDAILVGGTAGSDAITTTQAAVGSFAVAGGPSAGSNAIANMEAVRIEAGGGQDNVTLNLLPAGNLSYAVLGGGDNDVATLVATAGDDSVVVSGQSVTLGSSVVTAVGVEDLRLDAGGGTDLLSYSGVNGVAEDVQFLASATANAGTLRVVAAINLAFANVETADATGNPADDDRLTFAGTDALDRLEIDLSAAGTAADPVLRLLNGSGGTLLTFLNYTNFDTLRVNTLDGEDVINVYTDATAPGGGRNLFVDGGLPSGKKKSTDKLTVFYTPPRPAITHSAETQDPDNGLIDLDYDTARFLVQYADIEAVVIKRL